MALPQIGDGEQIGDGNTNESLLIGRSGQAVKVQPSSTGQASFYGASLTTKPGLTLTTAAIASLTTSSVCAMTTTQLQTLQTTVNNLVLTVQTLGLSS